MKKQALVVFLTLVMVASAFGALSLGTTKASAAGETLTLTSSTYNPISDHYYTLTAYLRDSAGHGLNGKTVQLFYHYEGKDWANRDRPESLPYASGSDGKYSTNVKSTQTVYLQAGYYVNNAWVSSNVIKITPQAAPPTGPLTLTLAPSTVFTIIGGPYTLSGYLRDSAGHAIVNKPIEIWYKLPDVVVGGHTIRSRWAFSNTVGPTDGNGKYSTTTSSSQSIQVEARYKVNGAYVAISNVVPVTVMKWPTGITLTKPDNPTTVHAIYPLFTVSGRLTTLNGLGLAGRTINIWFHYVGDPADLYTLYPLKVTTDNAGYYSATVSTAKSVEVHTGFPGDDGWQKADTSAALVNVVFP